MAKQNGKKSTKKNGKKKGRVLYGHVSSAGDITNINDDIRAQVTKAKTKARLTELVDRSHYLRTLTFSPAWKKGMRGKIKTIRTRAENEYCKTARAANKRMMALGQQPIYALKVNYCKK